MRERATAKLPNNLSVAKRIAKQKRGNVYGEDDEVLLRRYLVENIEVRLRRADKYTEWTYVLANTTAQCNVCKHKFISGEAYRLKGTRALLTCGECVELSTLPDSEKPGPFDDAVRSSLEDTRVLFSSMHTPRVK